MQGAQMIFGFIGKNYTSEASFGRGIAFANAACTGLPLANAWLDAALKCPIFCTGWSVSVAQRVL
jgi:hypothetical protein